MPATQIHMCLTVMPGTVTVSQPTSPGLYKSAGTDGFKHNTAGLPINLKSSSHRGNPHTVSIFRMIISNETGYRKAVLQTVNVT